MAQQIKGNAILTLRDHLEGIAIGLEWVVTVTELAAIAILILGLLRFAGHFLSGEILRREAHARDHQLNKGRLSLGRHILAGLEVLIVADLIRTVLHLSLENTLLLGALVVIRSFISFSLEHEMRSLEKD